MLFKHCEKNTPHTDQTSTYLQYYFLLEGDYGKPADKGNGLTDCASVLFFLIVVFQSLEMDQGTLQRMKKMIKAIHTSGLSKWPYTTTSTRTHTHTHLLSVSHVVHIISYTPLHNNILRLVPLDCIKSYFSLNTLHQTLA